MKKKQWTKPKCDYTEKVIIKLLLIKQVTKVDRIGYTGPTIRQKSILAYSTHIT